MKTHAQTVLDICGSHFENVSAAALSMGYAVDRKQDRILFSDHYGDRSWNAPKVSGEKRNRAGRMVAATYTYIDGSRLRFTWSDNNGARLKVVQA